jgi:hypothetical protein
MLMVQISKTGPSTIIISILVRSLPALVRFMRRPPAASLGTDAVRRYMWRPDQGFMIGNGP